MRKEKYLGEVIAVTNQKGGCGKTTVTMNLGVALSKIGYKVLCVDIDKQVNLTSGLIKNTDKLVKTDIGVILQNVLDDKKQKTQKFIVHTRYVDIIPGNRSLYKYKSLFEKREDRNTVYKNLFENLRKNYDFILLDCPPEAGIQNVQAYTAATNILIVTEPTLYSTDGIIDAIEIAQVAKNKTNSELNILGIVINKMNNWKDQFDCVEYIRNSFAKYVYVFDTIIPNRASVDRATSNAKSVIQHRSKDKASLAFQKLAEEVLNEVSHYD